MQALLTSPNVKLLVDSLKSVARQRAIKYAATQPRRYRAKRKAHPEQFPGSVPTKRM